MTWPAYGTSVPSLSNYQYSIGGVTLGIGTNYRIQRVSGAKGAPAASSSDAPRSRAHGQWAGYNIRNQGRDIEIELRITGDGTHTAQYYLTTLTAALSPELTGTSAPNVEQNLWYQHPDVNGGSPVSIGVRLMHSDVVEDVFAPGAKGYVDVSIWLHATDWRWYGATVQSTATGATGTYVAPSYTGNVDVDVEVDFVKTSGTVSNASINAKVAGVAKWTVNFEPGTASGSTYSIFTDRHLVTKASVAYASATATAPTWPNPVTAKPAILNLASVHYSADFSGGGSGTITLTYAPGFIL